MHWTHLYMKTERFTHAAKVVSVALHQPRLPSCSVQVVTSGNVHLVFILAWYVEETLPFSIISLTGPHGLPQRV